MDLTISDPSLVSWIAGGGLRVDNTGASKVTLYNLNPGPRWSQAAVASNKFSVEIWALPRDVTSLQGHIFQVGVDDTCANVGAALIQNGPDMSTVLTTTPPFPFTDGPCAGSRDILLSPSPLSPGVKSHFVWTWDGSMETLYVDGSVFQQSNALGGTLTWPGASAVSFANSATGCTAAGCAAATGPDWSGDLYTAALYADALPAATVTQLFNAGSNSMSAAEAGATTSAGTLATTTAATTTTAPGATTTTPGTVVPSTTAGQTLPPTNTQTSTTTTPPLGLTSTTTGNGGTLPGGGATTTSTTTGNGGTLPGGGATTTSTTTGNGGTLPGGGATTTSTTTGNGGTLPGGGSTTTTTGNGGTLPGGASTTTPPVITQTPVPGKNPFNNPAANPFLPNVDGVLATGCQVEIRLNADLATFELQQFVDNWAGLIGVVSQRISIIGVRQGSVIVTHKIFDTTQSNAVDVINPVLSSFRAGTLAAPAKTAGLPQILDIRLISVDNPNVSGSSGSSGLWWWLIALIAGISFVLIVVFIIVMVCRVKRHKEKEREREMRLWQSQASSYSKSDTAHPVGFANREGGSDAYTAQRH